MTKPEDCDSHEAQINSMADTIARHRAALRTIAQQPWREVGFDPQKVAREALKPEYRPSPDEDDEHTKKLYPTDNPLWQDARQAYNILDELLQETSYWPFWSRTKFRKRVVEAERLLFTAVWKKSRKLKDKANAS